MRNGVDVAVRAIEHCRRSLFAYAEAAISDGFLSPEVKTVKTESEAAYAGVESALQNAAAAQARDQGDIMEAERQLWEKSRTTLSETIQK